MELTLEQSNFHPAPLMKSLFLGPELCCLQTNSDQWGYKLIIGQVIMTGKLGLYKSMDCMLKS